MRKNNFTNQFSIALAAVLLIALSAGSAKAEPGLKKIAENVYAYVDTKHASPRNGFGANAGIIVGKDGILVVDTLISAKMADKFLKDIRTISDKPIRYVVNTHSHLDHCFGNAEFEKLGVVIVAHRNSREDLWMNGEATMKRARTYGLTDDDLEGTTIALPKITFTDRMEIDLGGQAVTLIDPGPSHTDGSIMVYLPDKKVLFAGDILFTDYHPNLAGGDIEGWIKTLDFISTLDVIAIIPRHGPVSGKKDIADMRNYLVVFDKKAKELCAGSNDPDWIVSELRKALPQRPELEMMIKTNIQMRYLAKKS
jgi:glyoxylase-like metal-dependent hydrolase (beta-lactamase superfamily II)